MFALAVKFLAFLLGKRLSIIGHETEILSAISIFVQSTTMESRISVQLGHDLSFFHIISNTLFTKYTVD
jgi:hypothetical protein